MLLLPLQVPGGARRAREGAPGQVGARPAAEPGARALGRAGEVGSLRGHPEAPGGPFLEILPLGWDFCPQTQSPGGAGDPGGSEVPGRSFHGGSIWVLCCEGLHVGSVYFSETDAREFLFYPGKKLATLHSVFMTRHRQFK